MFFSCPYLQMHKDVDSRLSPSLSQNSKVISFVCQRYGCPSNNFLLSGASCNPSARALIAPDVDLPDTNLNNVTGQILFYDNVSSFHVAFKSATNYTVFQPGNKT